MIVCDGVPEEVSCTRDWHEKQQRFNISWFAVCGPCVILFSKLSVVNSNHFYNTKSLSENTLCTEHLCVAGTQLLLSEHDTWLRTPP